MEKMQKNQLFQILTEKIFTCVSICKKCGYQSKKHLQQNIDIGRDL